MRIQTKGSMYIFTGDSYDELARRYCDAVWRRRVEKGRGDPDEPPWTEWPLQKWLEYEAESHRFHYNVEVRTDTAQHFFEDMIANDLARYVPDGWLCFLTPDEQYIAAPDYEDTVRQLQNVGFNFHPEQPVEEWMREYAGRLGENEDFLETLGGKPPRSDTAQNFIDDLIAIAEIYAMPDE